MLRFFEGFFVLASLASLAVSPSLAAPAPRGPQAVEARAIRLGGLFQGSPAWRAYRGRFVDEDGRVLDTGNGGVSHSEGQGYAMLLAAAAADRDSFERIWSWTQTHLLVRGDRLAAWRWPGANEEMRDFNNASDGDLLIAWALAEAADYWSDPDLLAEARGAARDILRCCVRRSSAHGPLLMPGARGFGPGERSDGPIVNLSYWAFPALIRLAQIEPSDDWTALRVSGSALLSRARFGDLRLPPDWLSLSKNGAAPAQGFAARFGYDALRIPLYLFWARAETPGAMAPFANAWPTAAPGVQLVDLDQAGAGRALSEPGYRAVAALARCAVSAQPYPDDFYRFQPNQHYYPATLHLLSVAAAASRGGPCLDRGALNHVVSADWRPAFGGSPGVEPPALAPIVTLPFEEREPVPPRASILAGVAIPAEEYGLVFYLRAAAIGLALIFVVRWLRRRAGASADEPGVDVKEEMISQAISAIRPGMSHANGLVPRNLPDSPFTRSSDPVTLGGQIEIAAEACVRLGRTMGIIYFEIPHVAPRPASADMDVGVLAAALRRALRPTDHVAILGRDQIVVCVCLLATATDLHGVGARLSAVSRRQAIFGDFGPPPIGYAMYPLDAYGGEELIEAARADYRRQSEQIAIAPWPSPAVVQLADTAKTAATKRGRTKRRSPPKETGDAGATT